MLDYFKLVFNLDKDIAVHVFIDSLWFATWLALLLGQKMREAVFVFACGRPC
jgi:hypothetical protein